MIAILIGFVVGVIVNLIADYLPARRHYDEARRSPFSTVKPVSPQFVPHLPSGQRAPLWLWSGVIAALTQTPVFNPPRRWRRILIELGLAAAFGWLTARFGSDSTVFFLLAYAPLLTLIAVIDIEHRWVMLETILALLALVVIEAIVQPRIGWESALNGAVLAFGVSCGVWLFGFVFGALVKLVTGRRVVRTILGFGDVQIAALGGLILGWQATGPMLVITALFGGIGVLVFIGNRLRRRRFRAFSAIAYGPYIVAAIALMLYAPEISGGLLVTLIWR